MTSRTPEEAIIADSSCLIALDRIGRLNLLEQLYGQVIIPEAVRQEFGTEIPAWLQVEEVLDRDNVQKLSSDLGKGEAEAIALALEKQPCTLILDDKKARRIAGSLQLKLTGILGVLVKAKELRLIENVHQLIQELEDSNFYITVALKIEVLKLAGEQWVSPTSATV